MLAEFKHTLRRMRGQMIGWSIGIGLYGYLMVALFDSIVGIEGFDELMASYPQEIMGFFGDMMAITTPKGYIDVYFFNYMPVIIGIFAVSAGASLLVRQEEEGVLDLVMAHPISRAGVFWGRLLGYLTSVLIILGVSWLTWWVPSGGTGLTLTALELARPFLPLLVQLLLFGFLALLLSMILPSSKMAGGLTGGLLVANYLIIGLSNLNDQLGPIMEYTPLKYYQGGAAMDGLNWEWLLSMTGIAILLALIAWWRFNGRDIRVGGEGGWRLPSLLFWRKRTKAA
jgi:ABC-2 type transport system permease protein